METGFDSKKSYLAGALADPSLWVRGEPPAYSPLVVLGCAARTLHRLQRQPGARRLGLPLDPPPEGA
jgi:hypothetical protein